MSTLDLTVFVAGHCVHPEHAVLRNLRLRRMQFPASFALLEHPARGPVLFDTGYAEPFLAATRRFPARLHRVVTPVTFRPEDSAAHQLSARGIRPADVRQIVISHFHGDHIAGLAEFPNAELIHLDSAWRAVRDLSGLRGLRRGFLPSLVPRDFTTRSRPIEDSRFSALPGEFAPFRRGVDLFGDGSCWVVALPGHAAGQLGLFVRASRAGTVFLCADAAWASRSIREDRMPSQAARLLFDDWGAYRTTLHALHELQHLRRELVVVPAHCGEALARFDSAAGGLVRR